MGKTKRMLLGLLLTLGMILGVSILGQAASVSSVTVKEITADMTAGWDEDSAALTINENTSCDNESLGRCYGAFFCDSGTPCI